MVHYNDSDYSSDSDYGIPDFKISEIKILKTDEDLQELIDLIKHMQSSNCIHKATYNKQTSVAIQSKSTTFWLISLIIANIVALFSYWLRQKTLNW